LERGRDFGKVLARSLIGQVRDSLRTYIRMFGFEFNYRLVYRAFDLLGINNIDMGYINVYNAMHNVMMSI
jgi:hypothetical protein